MLAEIALKDPSVPLGKDAALALINLSADVDTAKKMTKPSKSNQQMVLTLWQMKKPSLSLCRSRLHDFE